MNIQPISALFRSISQPARLEIILALGSGEACVCHLETATGLRQAYISQHLMALRGAGIVNSRREGRNVYYRLQDLFILELIREAGMLVHVEEIETQALGPANLHGECPCPKCIQENSEMVDEPSVNGQKGMI